MNRRLFLAALVSVVSAKFFPQRAAAHRFNESNGTTRVSGDLKSFTITDSPGSWKEDQWKFDLIAIDLGDTAELHKLPATERRRFAENVDQSTKTTRRQIKIERSGPPHQFISFSDDFRRRKLQVAATPE